MIFVTVGSMFPFERMIHMLDDWTFQHPEQDVFAQIGAGKFEPRHMRWKRTVPPNDYMKIVQSCRLIVAHAGTGTVFAASEFRKPIVLIPRRASLQEHTTDHQLDTAKWLEGKRGVFIVWSEEELASAIEQAFQAARDFQSLVLPPTSQAFLDRIRTFIQS